MSKRVRLRVLSLFSGIGGIDLGLERAGMTIVAHSEIDPYASRVLAKHWPGVPNVGDITKADWSDWVGHVDVIAGGFPCQPFSVAGKQKGEDDERYLFPEIIRAAGVLRPRYLILENVLGVTRWLPNIVGALVSLGYNVARRRYTAAEFGGPHLRPRIIIVAYSNGPELRLPKGRCWGAEWSDQIVVAEHGEAWATFANTDCGRLEEDAERDRESQAGRIGPLGHDVDRCACPAWGPPPPPIRGVDDGVPSRLDRGRLTALGNAVVPQVAEYIGHQIMQREEAA